MERLGGTFPIGYLPASPATEEILYHALLDVVDDNPEYALVTIIMTSETQYSVRMGGAVPGALGASLALVQTLRNVLRADDNPLGNAAMKDFPKAVQLIMRGMSFEVASGMLVEAHNEAVEQLPMTERLPPSPPSTTFGDTTPLAAKGIAAIMRHACDLSRLDAELSFSAGFALCNNTGSSWIAYLGGVPVHEACAVLSMLNGLEGYLARATLVAPKWKGVEERISTMVRDAWKGRKIKQILASAEKELRTAGRENK